MGIGKTRFIGNFRGGQAGGAEETGRRGGPDFPEIIRRGGLQIRLKEPDQVRCRDTRPGGHGFQIEGLPEMPAHERACPFHGRMPRTGGLGEDAGLAEKGDEHRPDKGIMKLRQAGLRTFPERKKEGLQRFHPVGKGIAKVEALQLPENIRFQLGRLNAAPAMPGRRPHGELEGFLMPRQEKGRLLRTQIMLLPINRDVSLAFVDIDQLEVGLYP